MCMYMDTDTKSRSELNLLNLSSILFPFLLHFFSSIPPQQLNVVDELKEVIRKGNNQ